MKGSIKFKQPFLMAAGLLVMLLLVFLFHLLYVRVTGGIMDYLNIWIYMMGASLVFSIFSTINLLFAENTGRYYNKTLMAFASLILVGGLLATWISGQSIFDLPTYRKVMIFVIIAFLALISIATLIKRVDEWSKNKDTEFLKKDKDDFE